MWKCYNSIGLFEDIAILDRKRKDFNIVQITRMVCGRQEFKRPVALDDTRDIQLHCSTYQIERHEESVKFSKRGVVVCGI